MPLLSIRILSGRPEPTLNFITPKLYILDSAVVAYMPKLILPLPIFIVPATLPPIVSEPLLVPVFNIEVVKIPTLAFPSITIAESLEPVLVAGLILKGSEDAVSSLITKF